MLFDNAHSDTHAWKEERKKHLTGTDIAKIMQYLVDGERLYYGEHITKIAYYKFNDSARNKIQKEKMELGHLYEELVHAEALNAYNDQNRYIIHRNRALKKDCFMCTLDIEVEDKETNKTTIVECKLTTSNNLFNSAKEGKHPLYWQCALQLFICDFTDMIHFTLKLQNDDSHKIEDEYISYITRDSFHYKKFLEYIPRLQDVHKILMEGKEPFLENMGQNTLFKDICNKLAELRIEEDEVSEEIRKLTDKKNMIKNDSNAVRSMMLERFSDVVHMQKHEYNGSLFTFQKRTNKVEVEDFEKIVENIKNSLKTTQKIQIEQAQLKYMSENGKPWYTIEESLVILRS